MSRQMRLTNAPHLPRSPFLLRHPTIPHLDHLINSSGGEGPGTVLVPVDGEDFGAGGGDGKDCCGERVREGGVGGGEGGRVGGGAKVKEADCAVCRGGGDDGGVVGGEEGLVDAALVRFEGEEGAGAVGGPLRASQVLVLEKHIWMEGTYEFNVPVPRRRDELVFLDVGPIYGEYLARVFCPCADGMILGGLH